MKTLVCAGRVSLETAQEAIRVNWRAAYRRYIGVAGARPSIDTEDAED